MKLSNFVWDNFWPCLWIIVLAIAASEAMANHEVPEPWYLNNNEPVADQADNSDVLEMKFTNGVTLKVFPHNKFKYKYYDKEWDYCQRWNVSDFKNIMHHDDPNFSCYLKDKYNYEFM